MAKKYFSDLTISSKHFRKNEISLLSYLNNLLKYPTIHFKRWVVQGQPNNKANKSYFMKWNLLMSQECPVLCKIPIIFFVCTQGLSEQASPPLCLLLSVLRHHAVQITWKILCTTIKVGFQLLALQIRSMRSEFQPSISLNFPDGKIYALQDSVFCCAKFVQSFIIEKTCGGTGL